MSTDSDALLASPHRAVRSISKQPYRVLDAPNLKDDFYLNLVDWSASNMVAVGLGSCVYLWNAGNGSVTKLCDLSTDSVRHGDEMIASVTWSARGTHLAVGTLTGVVQVWDVAQQSCIRSMRGHSHRVGVLAWGTQGLASGSRDRKVLIRDVRSSEDSELKYIGHTQEVCGLKWSPSSHLLASGGNDNKLMLWSPTMSQPQSSISASHRAPLHRFEHNAAVKAIAWSPDSHGFLASGGGTADRCIRFWNTSLLSQINCVDTGSQVCQLAFSHTTSELVSTHGYSLNQICVWKYPSMRQIANLTGHSMRVLYLAMSPDHSAIVTGAGDETLRFWNVFPSSAKSKQDPRAAHIGQPLNAPHVLPSATQIR